MNMNIDICKRKCPKTKLKTYINDSGTVIIYCDNCSVIHEVGIDNNIKMGKVRRRIK